MSKRLALMMGVSVLFSGPAFAQDVKTLLQAADAAIGASKVNSLEWNGKGRGAYLGQNFTVNDDWNRYDLQSFTIAFDFPSKSVHTDEVRVQGNNPRIGGGAGFPIVGEQRANAYSQGNFSWTLNAQGQAQPQNDAAGTRQLDLAINPHGFIKAAMADPNATVSDREFVSTGKNVKVVSFTVNGKWRVTGEFNNQNMLERVVTWVPSPMMGDMQAEYRFSDYRDAGNGIKVPYHVHIHLGDHPLVRGMNLFDAQATDVKVNVTNASLTVPDNVRNAQPPRVNIATTDLGNGAWLIAGGSHNSIAVEMKDFAVLIEAPLDEARTSAVIAEVKKLIPGKQIKYVVNTHHHWDHAGGLRTAYAEGATIVTNDQNRNFYERVILAPQPRSLSPDRLSMEPFATTGPGPGHLETYKDTYTISDGTQTVTAYHVQGFNHAQDMAIVYLPRQKVLINADMGPPPPNAPAAAVNANTIALYNNMKRLKLDVQRHVPIHGGISNNDDFEKTVGPIAAQQRPAGGEGG
jgi:glyoxylase-like metal-dependent hydrolase (beta-lactamase superfamily II)